MKPFLTLARADMPDGSQLTLQEHDGEHYLKLNGRQLMSTTSTSSELLLAQLACEPFMQEPRPRVLIGGLGLGYSLKRVLELLGKNAVVHVAELIPDVVEWNREFLGKVNGALLDDPRVEVFAKDVFELIQRAGSPGYDAILLDVDNGPTSFVQAQNSRLYSWRGFDRLAKALNPGGRATFWSAVEERGFFRRLTQAGFKVEAVEARAHERAKRFAHWIYVAEWRGAPDREELEERPVTRATKPPSPSSQPRHRKGARRDSAF